MFVFYSITFLYLESFFFLDQYQYLGNCPTAQLPLPEPNINLNCCWVRGGEGGQLLRY